MNRIVLALLALFAGIAAQVTPAEARVRGQAEVGAVLAQRSATRTAASVQIQVALRAENRIPEVEPAAETPRAFAPLVVPAVRIRIDRARE
ncbi:MAG: hypothetical protein ACKOPM_10855 [Novosphingobium sp.]